MSEPWPLSIPQVEHARLIADHPIARRGYKHAVAGIVRLLDVAEVSIAQGIGGRVFYAPTRTGKSTAIKFVVEQLQNTSVHYRVHSIVARSGKNVSGTAFYQGMLVDLMAARKSRAGKPELCEQIATLFSMPIARGDVRGCLLLVDEAQKLTEDELDLLADVGNLMMARGKLLITVFLGQEALIHRPAVLDHRPELKNRFMRSFEMYPCVADEKGISDLLQCYDDATFPEGSDVSYSAFFRPWSYARGWRLRDEVPRLIAALEARTSPTGSFVNIEALTVAVETQLKRACFRDDLNAELTVQDWKEVLHSTGYVTFD